MARKAAAALQWWLCGVLLSILCVPAVVLISLEHGARIDGLRQAGLVTEAEITAMRQVEERYTNNKGRERTRLIDQIDLRYNLLASQPYADFVARGERVQGGTDAKALITYTRRSQSYEMRHYRVGDRVPVVIHPDERSRAELAPFVRDFSNRTSWIIVALLTLGGLVCGWFARGAWRRSKTAPA